MSEEEAAEVQTPKKKLTAAEKRTEHMGRIKRTLTACILGILTGVISFLAIDRTQIAGLNSYTILGLFIMIAGIVLQKHIFTLGKMAPHPLGAKDWLYQGFVTFALWFITWTIFLTA